LLFAEIQALSRYFSFPAKVDRNTAEKMLRLMKLFPRFFVLMSEANDKLYVAEIEHDDDHYETPAPRGRPAKSFAGADC
jgi:hypothetical protein